MIHILIGNSRTALGVRHVARLPQCAVAARPRTCDVVARPGLVRFKSTGTHTLRRQQQQSTAQIISDTSREASVWERVRDSLRSVLLKPRTVPIPRWISPQHYTITLSECFGHGSFILVAASYAVDDFLNLRIIAVAGTTAMLFFTYFHPHGRILWLPFQWNLLFIVINSYRIGKVYLDRYFADKLSDDLIRIRDNHFYVLDPVDFASLVRISKEETYNEGELVVEQGNFNRYIRLVVDGELAVLRDGEMTYILEEGNFVSEAGLHAGLLLPGKVESCCTIVARETTRVLSWDRSELMDTLRSDKSLRRALKAALSWDIVRKLKGQRKMLASGKIENPELWTQRRNEQNEHRYAAILKNMLCHPHYLQQRRGELNKYRMIHHIDDEHHRLALQRCGWTPEEFAAGFKEGQEVDDEDDIKRRWKWFLRDVYRSVFG